ncbi:hypothetical protein HXX76_008318 [Chlamydomonas incerta]|uniref:CSC1/OSCA1-like cytosolic domain-containing protein n=1 Tax=Chlamydomonas incerta TaxID=51695 RepID=A0A835T7W8_CHLIN|nr:hypothetical protein HXX76_008318 [Chlamydomonas incerta]|eukprot:KAG2433250.1 hypothetical protein HXX76_008318 [Chlamydomonas incerta]
MVEAQATLDIKFVDVKSARKKLKENAGKVAQEEDDKLEDQGLTLTSSFGTLAARRGVGVGLYFKILPWFGWMMVFMMFCAVPYLITINTSVFTDEAHKYDHTFGVKVFDTFELASFTFAAIVDNAKDAGLLQYMNTLIAGTWDGPMEKRTFLIWISVVDAFAIIALTAATGWLWYEVWKWLAKVDDRTREVADYSIIVGGLPPTVTATEVMDVVLVKNLAFVLAACKKVHRIEGLTSFLIDLKDKEGRQHQLEQNALAAGAQKVLSTARGAMGAAADAAGKAVNAAANAATTAATTVATTAAAAAAAAAAKTAAIIDMGSTAGAAAAAADVEAAKETHGAPGAATSFSPAMQRKMNKAESRIQVQRNKIHEFIDSGKMTTQAAFVTFNTENMRIDACNALPSGWWSAWFTPKQFLFEHAGQKWRLWVQRAASPDDYKYENMSTRIRNNYLIQCCTGAIMFGLILLCAAMITLLNTHASKSARDFKWDVPSMVKPLSKFNATTYNAYYNQFLRPKPSSGSGRRHLQAAARLYADSDNVDYYYMCRNSWVYDTCSAAVNNNTNLGLGNVQFNMRFMKEWTFGKWNSTNATELAESKLARLLFERPVRRYLSTCADNPTAPECYRANHTWVDVSGCLPCYCYALSEIDATKQGPGFIAHVKDTCKQYWAPFDLQRDGVKVAISFVIAIINSILSVVLRMLKVYVERHWTVTATERSLAIWTYVVKVVNSIVVLLVVNCSTLSELQNDAMESEVNGSNGWLSNLALSGLFDDFSPGWYQNVGFSIMILMMINVTSPFVRSISERITKLILQLQVMFLHCGRLHTPEQFNNAWRTPAFTLEQRSSDILFNLTLALLFGSGMPLCYLICAVYLLVLYWWDRANIAHFRQPSQRYSAALPRLMLFFFPVLIVLHCAFGIWMHTFFDPDVDPEVVMQAMVASNQDPTVIQAGCGGSDYANTTVLEPGSSAG